MPIVQEGVDVFFSNGLLYEPGKAAKAGGAASSRHEMTLTHMCMSLASE